MPAIVVVPLMLLDTRQYLGYGKDSFPEQPYEPFNP
jgi:hypothetical protein